MKKWILLIELVFVLGFIKSQNTDSIFLPIIQSYKTGIIYYEIYNSNIHNKSIPRNLMVNFHTENVINNEQIEAILYTTNDTLSIFNTKTKLQTKVYIESGDYLSHVYFYNYDSIFLFFEREFVYQMHNKKTKMPDFAIIDTLGHLKGTFSLDSVPYIYNGSNNPMIMLSRFNLKGNLIANNILYLPFSIYLPEITSPEYENITMKLLCAYNIKEKKLKMLDIQIPKNNIRNSFNEHLTNNGFDFKILNDTTIIYSFNYSSDIFIYHVNTDSSELVGSYPDFYFNNIVNPKTKVYSTFFYAPEYIPEQHVYLRSIYVREFNDMDISIFQLLDENFKVIGYSFGDSIWSPVYYNAEGQFISINRKENYIGEVVELGPVKTQSLTEIINSLGNKSKHIKYEQKISLPEDLTLKERMELYLALLNVPENSKVIVLSGDVICGNVLNFLLEQKKNNKKEYDQKNIIYLFYNCNQSTLESYISPYSLQAEDFVIDDQGLYNQIFGASKNGDIFMIQNKKKGLKIKKSGINTIVKDFKHLTHIKISQ